MQTGGLRRAAIFRKAGFRAAALGEWVGRNEDADAQTKGIALQFGSLQRSADAGKDFSLFKIKKRKTLWEILKF